MSYWALDFGTTNSVLARWNEEEGQPELQQMHNICREPLENQKINVQYSIPSCVYLLKNQNWKDVIGTWPLIQKYFFIGNQALIGKEALEQDRSTTSHKFINNFKPLLLNNSLYSLTKLNGKSYSAKQTARLFLREIFYQAQQKTGERPRKVTFSVPVDSYEPYRAQLKHIAQNLGVTKFNIIDEPVAAAIGYGLRIDEAKNILVIDFGGGTLDLALIHIQEMAAEQGRCQVIAKAGLSIGGNTVDGWLVNEICQRTGYSLSKSAEDTNIRWWYNMMLEEACRVKESLFLKDNETFYLSPPDELKNFEDRLSQEKMELPMDICRDELIQLLKEKNLYQELNNIIEDVLRQARNKNIPDNAISDVLLVGGSILLPNVYSFIENKFGRDRVRGWQPFHAVAYGACIHAAGRLITSDFITHDYAFVTYDKNTHEQEYNVIIPKGTPFPTPDDYWKRHLTPTCPLGEPEDFFKLIICEIGQRHSAEQEFIWDSLGHMHTFNKGEDEKQLIVPLNDKNPTLGTLNPPHPPGDKKARLELSFMVNEERWLCATVQDLKTTKTLLKKSPVLRLK